MSELNIFFGDLKYTYIVKDPGVTKILHAGEVVYPTPCVKDGKIIDFATLENLLKETHKDVKSLIKKVNLILYPEISVSKFIEVNKKDLNSEPIDNYLEKLYSGNLIKRFDDPKLEYKIIKENNDSSQVYLKIFDEQIVKTYETLMKKAKLKVSKFYSFEETLIKLIKFRTMISSRIQKKEVVMIITLFDKLLHISVQEDGLTVFAMDEVLEKVDKTKELYFYIQNISTYFKTTLSKDRTVDEIDIIDLTSNNSDSIDFDRLDSLIDNIDIKILNIEDVSPLYRDDTLTSAQKIVLATNF